MMAKILTTKEKTDMRCELVGLFDSVRFMRDGLVVAKRGFFYTNGCTADQLARAVRKMYPSAVIVDEEEHFNAWPKDSFWRVTFRMPDIQA
jgi:hypothetical protein